MKTSHWRNVQSTFHAMLIAAVLVVASIAGALPARAADAFLEGRVVDAAGAPIGGIRVDVYGQSDGGEIIQTPTRAVTNSLGQYSVAVASDSSYRIQFTDTVTTRQAGPFPSEWHIDASSLETATPIPILSAGVTSIPDTILVAPVVREFVEAPVPTISGIPGIGEYLTATAGTWSPTPAIIDYRWYRNGQAVGWGPRYLLVGHEGGSELTVEVTVRKSGYVATTRKSVPLSIPLFEMAPAVPVIIGEARTGNILKVDPGTWTPSIHQFSYEWFRNGTKVPGITGSSYKLTDADLGQSLKVTATGSAMGYKAASRTSSATDVVARGSFTPVVPAITGEAVGGTILTAQPGNWGLSGASYSYQWYRSGSPISGAVRQSYYLGDADLGKTLAVKVTATASGVTTASSMSSATATVNPGQFKATEAPVVAGTSSMTAGQMLTTTMPSWEPEFFDHNYQWNRNGMPIPGATKNQYVLGANDLGKHEYSVTVNGLKSGLAPASATSFPIAVEVSPGTFNPGTPVITGTPKVGYGFAVTAPGWGPAPVSLKYQWYRDGRAVGGATAKTYSPTSNDLGPHTYSVRVTGTKSGFSTLTKTSAPFTVTVAKGTLGTDGVIFAPTGTKKAGYTLTASYGNWFWTTPSMVDPNESAVVRYQWYRSGTAIKGATGRTYRLTGADAGKTITLRYAVSLTGYNTSYRHSRATAVIAKGTLRTSTPSITGTKKVGYRLTAKPNTWTAGTKFKYQWYRSGKAIKGATGSSYRLVSADRYDSIKVRVTGYQTGWNTAVRHSGSTTKVR